MCKFAGGWGRPPKPPRGSWFAVRKSLLLFHPPCKIPLYVPYSHIHTQVTTMEKDQNRHDEFQ